MRLECKHEAGRAMRVDVYLEKKDVRITPTPGGVRIEIDGFSNGNVPGAPALPRRLLHVAIPEGTWPEPARMVEGKPVVLMDKFALVVPAQPLTPGVARKRGRKPGDAKEGGDEEACADPEGPARCTCRCCRPQPEGGPWEDAGDREERFAPPPPVPPDPDLYEAAARDPEPAKLVDVQLIGRVPVVAIDIRPVRYDKRGRLELVQHVSIEIPYGDKPRERASERELAALLEKVGVQLDPAQLQPMPEPEITSAAQARRYVELAKGLVINPEMIRIDRWIDIQPLLPADYVIITDNQSWDAETIAPIASLNGDMVAQFERLAAHKRARGVSAKVVTITDIVNGRYGQFRAGSRDLQEVIRKFVKHAHGKWGTAWLLLGGDVDVVPARHAAAAIEGHMDVAANDPPANNQSFWTGTFLKMRATNPGTWWPGNAPRQLVNAATGRLVPFDATGATATSGLGWYWTLSDYATRSTTPTEFVRVNGQAAVVNARLQWLYQWNRIPTDLYYASLDSWIIAYREISFWLFSVRLPYVYYPPHDWDALDNGLYAQYAGGADVDGVHWRTDLSVGRAPVQSATEAQAFVDKVIAYANQGYAMTLWNQPSWLERVLIAAENWGGGTRIWRDTASPPGNARFFAGTNTTVVNLGSVPANFENQLIAEISDSDRRELPYNANSSPTSRGWHFARSATDHAPPVFRLTFFGINIELPLTSQWIVVHGSAAERNPPSYLFDWTGRDGSMADQEQLRIQLANDLPGWRDVTRLYEDLTDLTPAETVAAPVAYLTGGRMNAALNGAPHVVSLSGHGSPNGCCTAGVAMANALGNGRPGFIAYADSCLTGAFDSEDAFAEALLKNPNGGAVAYVGSTRFSWIGVGDDVQRAFFSRLKQTRHIGLLNDSRMAALDFNYWHAYARWIAMSLTLFGDPEMRVWRSPPRLIWPKIRWRKPDLRIPVEIELPRPPRPDEIGRELPTHYWVGVSQAGGFERLERAEAGSVVSIDVSQARPGALTVSVNADADDYAPYEQVLEIAGPRWIVGRVLSLAHGDDTRPWTSVEVRTADGVVRRLTVHGKQAAQGEPCCEVIVQALLDSLGRCADMALQVDRDGDGARIEGFRAPA